MLADIAGFIGRLMRQFDEPDALMLTMPSRTEGHSPAKSSTQARIIERASMVKKIQPRQIDWLLPNKRRAIEAWRQDVARASADLVEPRKPTAPGAKVALAPPAPAPKPSLDTVYRIDGAPCVVQLVLSANVASETYVLLAEEANQALRVPTSYHHIIERARLGEQIWQLLAHKMGTEAELLVSALASGLEHVGSLGGLELLTDPWLNDVSVLWRSNEGAPQLDETLKCTELMCVQLDRLNALPLLRAEEGKSPRWVSLMRLKEQIDASKRYVSAGGRSELVIELEARLYRLDAFATAILRELASYLAGKM